MKYVSDLIFQKLLSQFEKMSKANQELREEVARLNDAMKLAECQIYRDHDGNLWRVVRRWSERIHNHETLEEDFAAQLTGSKHWELFDKAGQAKFSDTKLILLQPGGER